MKSQKNRWKDNLKLTFAMVAVACCIICAGVLISNLLFQRHAATVFEQPAFEDTEDAAAGFSDNRSVDSELKIDWEYWRAVNSDVVGWVCVPDTNINYPVVQAQAQNPTYYLTHDVYKNPNQFGVPYIDAECTVDGLNVIVYGHNMGADKSVMFGEFSRYRDYDYMLAHPNVIFTTPNETRVLTVMAAEITSGNAPTRQTDFETREELIEWYHRRCGAATVKRDNPPDEQIIQVFTFVTCSYNYESNERTLVFAVDFAFKDSLITSDTVFRRDE
jgi:sortase B